MLLPNLTIFGVDLQFWLAKMDSPDDVSHKSVKVVEESRLDDCADIASEVEMQTVQSTKDEPVYSIFSTRQKSFYVAMATVAAMFSPLTATIYYPALNQLAFDFHTTAEVVNVTIITYMGEFDTPVVDFVY